MLKSSVYLESFDSFTLTFSISAYEPEAAIRRLSVVDRFGFELGSVQFDTNPSKHAELRLEKVARRRFPVFLEGSTGSGAPIPKTATGPIFGAPTDPLQKEGVSLPTRAIDILNDPVLRPLSVQLDVMSQNVQVSVNRRRRNAALQERYLASLQPLAIQYTIFAAAALVIVAQNTSRLWLTAPFVAMAGLVLPGVGLFRRLRSLRSEAALLDAETVRLSDAEEELIRKLRTFGVSPKLRLNTQGCGCGGSAEPSERQ